MTDLLVLLAVVAVTGLVAAAWRRRDGAVRAATGTVDTAALGAPPGATVLLELTAPACGPCVQARRVLDGVADGRPDVVVVEAPLEDHLDLVREHGILRAPTTLVLDPDGAVRGRVSGVPAAADLDALLGEVSAPAA